MDKPAGSASNQISGPFLAHLIDNKNLASKIGRSGIHIKNATITGAFDLSNATLGFVLFFEDCTFQDDVRLDWISTSYDIIFHKTSFLKPISAKFARSTRSIYFGNVDIARFQIPLPIQNPRPTLAEIDLSRSQFDGDIIFGNVDIAGSVVGRYVRTGSSLVFDKCSTKDLNLSQSVTKNQLMIVDCQVSPDKPEDHTPFAVNLYSTQVGQALHLNRSTFQRRFYAENINVHGAFQAREAHFTGLILAGASIGALDLGSTTGADRKLWTHAKWQHPSLLNVRGARATSIIAARESAVWPEEINLDGFIYNYIGRQPFQIDVHDRLPVSWYIDLLARDSRYSPQPYEQLAKVLRESGGFAEAEAVLYAGRDRQLRTAWNEGEWNYLIWQFLFKIFIGYGHAIWYALLWAIGFVLLGAFIFRRTPEAQAEQMPYGIAFSFDRLLPLVKLRERHYKIDLKGWPRYYFYAHQLMGYVLGSFLIAGLSGLAK